MFFRKEMKECEALIFTALFVGWEISKLKAVDDQTKGVLNQSNMRTFAPP